MITPPPPPPFHILFLLLAIYQSLRVFQLTFVEFWHVCNLRLLFHLLLAKIFNFDKYVRLTVCLSVSLFVCLFVCNIHDTGRIVQAINTKLRTYMELKSGYRCIVFGINDVIDDIIRSKSRSNFEIATTPSIFKLQRRTKSQNVGNGMAYLAAGLNFRNNFRFKSSHWHQNGGHFEDFEIF